MTNPAKRTDSETAEGFLVVRCIVWHERMGLILDVPYRSFVLKIPSRTFPAQIIWPNGVNMEMPVTVPNVHETAPKHQTLVAIDLCGSPIPVGTRLKVINNHASDVA